MLDLHFDGIDTFLKRIEDKRLICYGAGKHFFNVLKKYKSFEIAKKITAVVDRDESKHKQVIGEGENKWVISNLTEFVDMTKKEDVVVLLTLEKNIIDVVKYLDSIQELGGVCTYISSYLDENICLKERFDYAADGTERIPRMIHYCWFGGNEIPGKYRRYIETWKEKNPNYEIKKWDETNYDVSKNRYMAEAYSKGKWAFVSDYARIDIVNEYGGIYLDCDVEVLKAFDSLLCNSLFCGFEYNKMINLGLGFGATAHHPYLERLIELYHSLSFLKNDGDMNLTPCTVYQTETIKEYGIKPDGSFQKTDLITVFPRSAFAPISYFRMGEPCEATYSMHHYDASWLEGDFKDYWQNLGVTGKWIYERYKKQVNV